MLTPEELKKRWRENDLSRCSAEILAKVEVDAETKRFLMLCGLPKESAPYLTFDFSKTGRLRRISEVWSRCKVPEIYIYLGSDGCGNPIGLDEKNGRIAWLDHEDGFKAVVMNQSCSSLMHCLVYYKEFVEAVQKSSGESGFLDGLFSPKEVSQLELFVLEVEPAALEETNFWRLELDNLWAEVKG